MPLNRERDRENDRDQTGGGRLTAAACLTRAAVVASLMRSGTGGFKSTMTTLFWVGEPSDADNDFIPNDVSYWDNQCS